MVKFSKGQVYKMEINKDIYILCMFEDLWIWNMMYVLYFIITDRLKGESILVFSGNVFSSGWSFLSFSLKAAPFMLKVCIKLSESDQRVPLGLKERGREWCFFLCLSVFTALLCILLKTNYLSPALWKIGFLIFRCLWQQYALPQSLHSPPHLRRNLETNREREINTQKDKERVKNIL